MSSTGEETRHEILDRAVDVARVVGLGGVTIGRLADELSMSKSGLFAHFGSKEALQIAILDHAVADFVEHVVRPALAEPRGAPRLRRAFESWLAWGLASERKGGCLFVGASAELDDQPGPVRERLVETQRDWLDSLAQIVRSGQRDGRFVADLDPDQVAFELNGILLAAHQAARLFRDPDAERRAGRAFDQLLARVTV